MRGPTAPFAGVALLSMVMLFTPGSQIPKGSWWVDDVVHAGLFAALAITGRRLPVRWEILVAGLAGYAVLSEVVHAVAPLHRSGSVLDVLADVIGIGVGLLTISARHQLGRARTWRYRAAPQDPPAPGEPTADNPPPRETPQPR